MHTGIKSVVGGVNKTAHDVGMMWTYCGVVPRLVWFHPYMHVLIFGKKTMTCSSIVLLLEFQVLSQFKVDACLPSPLQATMVPSLLVFP